MQHESVDGVVVRATDMGDHDRYLSILTAEQGRITMLAKGSRSLRGEQRAISQMYTYANFEFYRRGSMPILKGGSPIKSFYPISQDIDRLNLASYLCELACELTDEGVEAHEMLRMLLNALYSISTDRYPHEIIKGAFEIRAAVISGYEPSLDGCLRCGSTEGETLYLDVMNGGILCAECLRKKPPAQQGTPTYDDLREAEVICPMTPSVFAALRYCSTAPLERLFSFELKESEEMRLFSSAAETYLLSHIGHGFRTLDFYRAMKEP